MVAAVFGVCFVVVSGLYLCGWDKVWDTVLEYCSDIL